MTNDAHKDGTPQYDAEEFVYNYYLVGNENEGRRQVLVIEHRPTGRHTPPISCEKQPGGSFLVAKNEAFERLVQELRDADIAPQPKREGTKRLGKARWNRKDEAADGR